VPVDVSAYPDGTAEHLEAFEKKLKEPGIAKPRAIILCVRILKLVEKVSHGR
jgi:hypothetical protein